MPILYTERDIRGVFINLNKKRVLWGLAIGLLAAVISDTLYMGAMFKGLEAKTFDARVRHSRSGKIPHKDIALILIDESSLKAMNQLVGRWPWPRSIYGELLEFLSAAEAKAVLFDILFTENEEAFNSEAGLGQNDQVLVESTSMAGNAYHAAQILEDTEDELNKDILNKTMPQDFLEAFSVENISGDALNKSPNNNYYLPFAELYRVSRGVGVVEFSPDNDGIYRRTKLFRHYRGAYFPVISAAFLLDELQPENVVVSEDNIRLDNMDIPLYEGNYVIGMYDKFNAYSMGGVLASVQKIQQGDIDELPVSPEEFKNKIVLIGASAVGVEDLKATSMESRTPGVMLHASLISNVLQKDFLYFVPKKWTRLFVFAASMILGLSLLITSSFIVQTLFPIILAGVYVALAFLMFGKSYVIDLVPPVFSFALVWLVSLSYLYLTEGRDKRKVKRMLGQYVSPAVLNELMAHRDDYIKAEVGSKENLTILFSDIRGFTSMSEHMSAEQVVHILNKYLSAMVDIIFQNKGTLDKFIGDAIMAFWGAPVKVENHAHMAVKAALEMTKKLEELNMEFEKEGLPRLQMGIGLHSGDVVLGNIGSEKKLDYTVIGDNVNLASRLEGLTKNYGSELLVSESTYEGLPSGFLCRIADNVRVKGKVKPVRIYSVLGTEGDSEINGDIKRKVCIGSEEAFKRYLNRDFAGALEIYNELIQILGRDVISENFIDRCNEYIKNPPDDNWDGVFTMKTK